MCTSVYAVVPQENFTHCWKYSAPLQSGIWSSRVLWFNKGFVKINAQHGPETSDSFIYLGLNRGRLPARKTGVRICLNLGRKQSTSFKNKTKQKKKQVNVLFFKAEPFLIIALHWRSVWEICSYLWFWMAEMQHQRIPHTHFRLTYFPSISYCPVNTAGCISS